MQKIKALFAGLILAGTIGFLPAAHASPANVAEQVKTNSKPLGSDVALTGPQNCILKYIPVNNVHIRLELDVCVDLEAGASRHYSRWLCFYPGTTTRIECNIGADHARLIYNGVLKRDNTVSGVGIGKGITGFIVTGSTYPCAHTPIRTDVGANLKVRSSIDNVLTTVSNRYSSSTLSAGC